MSGSLIFRRSRVSATTRPYYNEKGKTGIFYAESWALVHMLNFAPEYRAGLANFIEMILGRRRPGESFSTGVTAKVRRLYCRI